MKKMNFLPVVAVSVMALGFGACNNAQKSASLKTSVDSMSYAIGVNAGSSFKQNLENIPGGEANLDDLIAGFVESINGKETKITAEQAMTIIQDYFAKAEAADAVKAKEEGAKFLAEKEKEAGVVKTASGLLYKVEKEGTGEKPAAESTVKVNYKGTLANGETFDSSYDRGEPAEFAVNQVIPGWTEGLQLMTPGAKYIFYIPSELAYGDRAAGPKIKPNSALVFEVELLEVKPADKK